MKTEGQWKVMAAVAVMVVVAALAVALLASRGSAPGAADAPVTALPSVSAEAVVATLTPLSGPDGSASAVSSASAPVRSPRPSPERTGGRAPGEPDPQLTPGAVNPDVTQADIGSTICRSGWTATVRPPASYTTTLKRTQIAQYGYADRRLSAYEEDHLISLELGGSPRSPSNLWPEPYTVTLPDGTPVGARVKDRLENTLNDLVCSGAMPLATAQRLIATDWIAAWREYVPGG